MISSNGYANVNGRTPIGVVSFPPADSTYAAADRTNAAIEDGAYSIMVDGYPSKLPQDHHHDNLDHHAAEDTLSTTSSTMTAEGLADPSGFSIICCVVLVGDMTRGVTFPIMWPLVQDLGGNSVWLGYAVGAFSFGRVLASPCFGKWVTQKGYATTLITSTSIMLVGCILFAHVYIIGSLWFLIFSQIVLGVGSATLGVTRAYVAEITATRQRTMYMALLTAVQYGAFSVTPIFGALFSYLLTDQSYAWGFFIFNQYSAAAFFMAFLCIITLFVLSTKFEARYRVKPALSATSSAGTGAGSGGGVIEKKSKRRLGQDELANRVTFFGLTIYNAALLGCMLLNIMTKGSIGAFETMGIHFAQSYFNLDPAVAGTIVSINGAIGVCTLLSMGYIGRILSDIQMILGGIGVFAAGILSFVPLQSVEMGADNSIVHYVIGITMIYGIGYPIGHTALIGLFSKVVGRIAQGPLQGWFAAAGSLSRIFFPIMAGYIAHYDDMTTIFIVLFVVLVVANITVALTARTLTVLSQ